MNTPRLVLLSLFCAPLAGCVINADSHSHHSGRYVGAETLAKIEPGKSAEYVTAVLGEPSSRSALPDGTSIWKWTYREHKTSSAGVFLLYSGDRSTDTERATYVEFKDGVVVKSWQD